LVAAHFSHYSTLPSIFKHLARFGDLLDRNIDEVFAATTAAAFHEPHSDSGPEEKREEVGDDERVDDLLGVASRRRPLLATEPDAVEGSAGGVVGAQLARRRRFPTSDNVGEFPIPWRDVGPRRPVPDELGGGDGGLAIVGGGGTVSAAVAVAEAVDVDALQLLADVGQLGVGTVRRRLGRSAG